MQDAITPVLRAIRDPAAARSAGLIGKQLLDRGDPAPRAAQYDFTSALPVQMLKTLAPSLMPFIDEPGSGPAAGND